MWYLTPVSLYDMAAMEQWLERMAGRGRFLVDAGPLLSWFEKGEPRAVRCRAVCHQAVRCRATQAIRCRTAPSGSGRPGDPDFPERNCLPIRIFDSRRPGNLSRAEKTPRNGHETAFWHGSRRFSSPVRHAKGPLAKKTPGRRFSSSCERPQAVPERGFVARNNGFSRTDPTTKPLDFAPRL